MTDIRVAAEQARGLAQAIRDDGCCHHWKEVVRFLDALASLEAALQAQPEQQQGQGLVHPAATPCDQDFRDECALSVRDLPPGWPEGAFFTDGEGRFYDENADLMQAQGLNGSPSKPARGQMDNKGIPYD